MARPLQTPKPARFFSSPPRAASSRILRALRRAIRVSAGERVLLRERPREDSDDGDGNWAATLQRAARGVSACAPRLRVRAARYAPEFLWRGAHGLAEAVFCARSACE